MRQPLIAGNWKMNGTKASVERLLAGVVGGAGSIQHSEMAVCPPFPFLQMAEQALAGSRVRLGAQNCATETLGAFTGEVAAAMLADFGCRYVIIGHSERRALYGEDEAIIAKKLVAAVAVGLTPILCVGETLEERERGDMEAVIAAQIDGIIALCGIAAFGAWELAYEPVWAIGTGKTATPAQAQEVHAFIRARLAAQDAVVAQKIRILYGGSMKGSNAPELLSQPDIDGGLIGGAALNADEFLAIARAGDAAANT
ncbi:triose-phosphate isomerase [uncultured Thiodictyon sp.]|uniref:triose-phosphate isomerase n=1 Tax=uncultured Thiodictyon sp. TaxID=1846217 RepID=UPI0025D13406|nr:triose-phosphate isomerase [uncultured Thiodictyon sp.]